MLSNPRRYHDERDLSKMVSLLQAGRAAGIPSYYVHPGDLKWWLYYPPLEGSWWDRIFLWEDARNQLLGMALLDPCGDTWDVFFQPELYDTPQAAEMYAWAEAALIPLARAAERRQISNFWVTPQDAFRLRWLADHDYRPGYEDIALVRDLAEPVAEAPLREGYTVRSCHGLIEVEARAQAQYCSFGNPVLFSRYLERFYRFMRSPAYAEVQDVVAVAADGCIASFAITWLDELNQVGLFEPVGAHPDYQRRGLGRAVMSEALRRLQSAGMQTAIVCTKSDNLPALKLYEGLGFKPYTRFLLYSREI